MSDERPTWFGAADRSLFGWLYVPDDRRSAMGVVLCPPLAEEERAAHRTFRRLGRSLADRGMVALRFDYDGTGDSIGAFHDHDRLESWLRSVQVAVDKVRSLGVDQVAVVGMRFGATLAAHAASRQLITPAALVLWDPCSGGKAFLREGGALHAMRSGDAADAPVGAVDTPGFRFDPVTVNELRSVDLGRQDPDRSLARRTLILTRSDRPLPKRVRDRMDGPGVEWAPAVGQGELVDRPPIDSQIPEQSLSQIVDWLARVGNGGRVELHISTRARTTVCESGAVTEEAVRLGSIGLFGIATVPDTVTRAPWVVLLNVANEHHIGPGRQWVELARKWASMGFRCLRLDQSGVGDSPAHPGQVENVSNAREWITDVPEVVGTLAADSTPVVIISLCAGAYSAMEAGFQTQVDAVVAVSPVASSPMMARSTDLFDPRRRATRPWIRPLVKLNRAHPKVAGGLWRIYRQFAVWQAPMAIVAGLVRRGTDVLLIANPHDARNFREVLYWLTVGRIPVSLSRRYRLVQVRGADHALLTQAAQREVAAIMTTHLAARYPSNFPAGAAATGHDPASRAASRIQRHIADPEQSVHPGDGCLQTCVVDGCSANGEDL